VRERELGVEKEDEEEDGGGRESYYVIWRARRR
jgi:hypothetical protein